MEKVLVSGGSGLIGLRLSALLSASGYDVHALTRSAGRKERGITWWQWDPERDMIPDAALSGVSHIIHLAGAGIADQRWSAARKRVILDSRVKPIELISEKLSSLDVRPLTFISSSAIGYYGDRGPVSLNEQAQKGAGFLADVCASWEAAAQRLEADHGLRTAVVRTGIVLSRKGGALPKMALPARMGAAIYPGDGSQFISWIHIDDLCKLYLNVLQQGIRGPVNAVAPAPVTAREFSVTLARVQCKPLIRAGTPAWLLRAGMGEMADMLLHGQRVIPERALEAGFQFAFPELEAALRDIFSREV